MATIQKYSTKKGIKWFFKIYAGINPQTGKKKYIFKRGFESKKSASLACAKFEVQLSQGFTQKPKEITFGEVYKEWFAEYKKPCAKVRVDVQKEFFRITFCHALVKRELQLFPAMRFKKQSMPGIKK